MDFHKQKVSYLSLFSGIGGFELGLQNVGVESQNSTNSTSTTSQHSFSPLCIGYSEVDKYAIQTYERHFNHVNYGDATKINASDLPGFDLLVGGFPCQSFSIAGKRRGFEDVRGTLFFDIARILAEKRPRHLVLENVKGLLSHEQGKTFQTILGVLADLGYRVEWQVLNSKHFGVPQNRERVYIVGHLRDECRGQVLPITGDSRASIEPVAEISVRPLVSEVGPFPNPEHGAGGQESSIRIRRLTPIECERLQGFPDDWTVGVSDSQRYKQCGNAVTVNVVEAVMSQLNECLSMKAES